MGQVAHLQDITQDLLLVSQSGNYHYVNEISLIYHSRNLLLYIIQSGTELFFNSTKFWLILYARTPVYGQVT